MSATRGRSTALIGAALCATLTIAGLGAWQVGAAPGDADATFVTIEPCRLFDTRASATQGARRSPLGPGETFTSQVTGSNGDCTGIPSDAVAVSLNVTITSPTERSFLTVFPADAPLLPDTSNLNWIAGQAPTPNKVDSKLSADGKVSFYNDAGTVNVLVDIAGYFTPTSLTELNARLSAVEAANASLLARVEALETGAPFAVSAAGVGVLAVPAGVRTTIRSIDVTAPVDGRVLVIASGTAVEDTGGDDVRSAIGTSPVPFNSNVQDAIFEAAGTEGDAGGLARNRSFPIAAGQTVTYYLTCIPTGSSSEFWGAQLDAVFLPD